MCVQVVAKARGQLDGTWADPHRGRLPLNESLAFMRYTLVHPESSKRMLPAFNGVGLSGARPPSPTGGSSWEEEKEAAGALLDPLLGPGAGAAALAMAAAPRPVVHCPPPAHVASAINTVAEPPLSAARCYAPSVFQVVPAFNAAVFPPVPPMTPPPGKPAAAGKKRPAALAAPLSAVGAALAPDIAELTGHWQLFLETLVRGYQCASFLVQVGPR